MSAALRIGSLAALGVALGLSCAEPALACGACYGQADGPLIDGARLGIWFMVAVTVGVQGGFAAFFLYLRRRAARTPPAPVGQEWSRPLLEGGGAGREDA